MPRISQGTGRRLTLFLAIPVLFLFGAFTVAWLNPGFVECRGFLEPESWSPLYAPTDGLITGCGLTDGIPVVEGETLMEWDDEWPSWNLRRIADERRGLDAEIAYLRRRILLFDTHREIESEELARQVENDGRLLENAALSASDYQRSVYRRESFEAGAEREAAEITRDLERVMEDRESLASEEVLWRRRLDHCRLIAPESGRFYYAETALSDGRKVMLPSLGPGRWVDSGRLVGYVIPECGMSAQIEIPQRHLEDCRPGQRVLISIDSRPVWSHPPVDGVVVSIAELAVGGTFHGVVGILSIGPGTGSDLALLKCADLTARVVVRSSAAETWTARTWEKFVLLANSPMEKKAGRPARNDPP